MSISVDRVAISVCHGLGSVTCGVISVHWGFVNAVYGGLPTGLCGLLGWSLCIMWRHCAHVAGSAGIPTEDDYFEVHDFGRADFTVPACSRKVRRSY